MTTQTEALKLALEALTHLRPTALTSFYTIGDRDKAITAIKEALAQQEQEPVAHTTGHCENHKQKGGCQLHNLQCGWPDCDRKPITAPQPEQETVGYWKEHAQGMQRDYDSLLADYEKLTQQEQEPVKYSDYEPDGVHHNKPEQKPVAWRAPNWGHGDDEWVYRDFDDPVLIADGKPSPNNEALYTAPPPRPRVGLTWEDANEIAIAHDVRPSTVKAIEAKLKE